MSNSLIVLRVLGPTELAGSESAGEDALVRQAKKLALLTYLALTSADGFRRRDQVITLFWNEQEQAQARTYLRKSLHGIRESLGVDPFLTRGEDELRVNDSVLWCDAVAIQSLAVAGDWDKVLSLFRGDLLDGVFAEGVAPEFQQWLDAERRRLRELAARAAGEVSRAAEARGDIGTAVVNARRARELDPNDERAVRRLIELLDLRGDRGAALKTYTEWQAWLFNEYGVEPDPETRKVANRVRAVRRGESHETPPAQGVPAPNPTPAPPDAPAEAVSEGPKGRRTGLGESPSAVRLGRRIAAAALGALILTVGILGAVELSAPWLPDAGPTSVAMVPLRTIGGSALRPTSDAVTEELVTALIAAPTIAFRGAIYTETRPESEGSVERIGRRLGVAYVVVGSLQNGAEGHRLTLRLFRSSDAIALWAGSFDFTADSVASVTNSAAGEIARAIASQR